MWTRSSVWLAVLTLAVVVLAACETEAERRAKENAAVNKQAGDEIARICALPEDQRDAELNRIRVQSGVVLYCPK
jgi:hypothetical protein